MERKLAIRKDSLDGRRIKACLEYGLPLNVLEALGGNATPLDFESERAKAGHYLFVTAFLFTTGQRRRVAVFDRAATKRSGASRLTTGKGLFCLITPDLSGRVSFEEQVLLKVGTLNTDRVALLGQGISERGPITYLLTVAEVALDAERSIALKGSADSFVGFFDLEAAAAELGESREVDHAVLCFLRGESFDRTSLIPSSIDCAIAQVVIGGLDIHRFSTLPSAQQVVRYVTLQVLVEKTLEEAGLQAHTIQTGDGCFVVFPGGREREALDFCLRLQGRLKASAERDSAAPLLRYGLHSGAVYGVRDMNQQANFIGDGINFCARLLAVKEPNVLYASREFYQALADPRPGPGLVFNRSTLKVKHAPAPLPVYILELGGGRDPS